MVDIVQKGHAALAQEAALVDIEEIGTPAFNSILDHMKAALNAQPDGAAIAAPQIGVAKRIFIISKRILKKDEGVEPEDQVYINPEIVKLSRKKTLVEEGCLSLRGWYGKVRRANRATIRAYDEHGNQFERGAGGLLAQAFQHECDHLNGILFDAKAEELWETSDDVPADKPEA